MLAHKIDEREVRQHFIEGFNSEAAPWLAIADSQESDLQGAWTCGVFGFVVRASLTLAGTTYVSGVDVQDSDSDKMHEMVEQLGRAGARRAMKAIVKAGLSAMTKRDGHADGA